MEQNNDEKKIEELTEALGGLTKQYLVIEMSDLFASFKYHSRRGFVFGFLAGAAIATVIGWLV